MSKLLTSPTQAVGSTTQIHETTLQLAELPGMASESLEESAASDDELPPLTSRADLPTESGLQKIIAVMTRMWKGAIISEMIIVSDRVGWLPGRRVTSRPQLVIRLEEIWWERETAKSLVVFSLRTLSSW